MNGKLVLLLLSLFAGVSARADEGDEESSNVARVQLVVLAMSRTYEGTVEEAKKAAAALGFEYSDRDLIYDEVDGLHWPKDYEDEIWAGGYVARRFDNECVGPSAKNGCITVERSESYPGMKEGYYVAVAGILGEEDARERLAQVRHVVRDAYVTDTRVYTGCMH